MGVGVCVGVGVGVGGYVCVCGGEYVCARVRVRVCDWHADADGVDIWCEHAAFRPLSSVTSAQSS